MAVVIIFSSLIGFASGLVNLAILGSGLWAAVQTYFLVSVALSLVLGTAVALARMQSRPAQVAQTAEQDIFASWDAWHAEEDLRTGRMIAKIAKNRAAFNRSA